VDNRDFRHECVRRGDVLILRVRGEFTLDDARAYVAIRDQIGAEQNYLLLLIFASEATGMHPAARRYVAEHATPHEGKNSAIAVVGAGAILRGLLQLLFSAITLLGRRPVFPSFVSDEATALRFLDEQRQRIYKQLGRK
jgi:hypothetical protein